MVLTTLDSIDGNFFVINDFTSRVLKRSFGVAAGKHTALLIKLYGCTHCWSINRLFWIVDYYDKTLVFFLNIIELDLTRKGGQREINIFVGVYTYEVRTWTVVGHRVTSVSLQRTQTPTLWSCPQDTLDSYRWRRVEIRAQKKDHFMGTKYWVSAMTPYREAYLR